MVLENVFLAEDMVMGVKEKKEAIAQSLKKDMGRFGRVDRVR